MEIPAVANDVLCTPRQNANPTDSYTNMFQYMIHKIPLFITPSECDGLATSPTPLCSPIKPHQDNIVERHLDNTEHRCARM